VNVDKELELMKALNVLCNNWLTNPELRKTFESILERLEAGTKREQKSAGVLREYLSYPGSDEALNATSSLQACLKTAEGRKAAGLPPRKKGKSYSSGMVEIHDVVMQVMINHELGLSKKSDVEDAVTDYIGLNAAPATRKTFIASLKPKAEEHAKFIKHFKAAANKKTPL
jgi:hypothetical protein